MQVYRRACACLILVAELETWPCSRRTWWGRSDRSIGLDRNPDILITARDRADDAGYTNIEFLESSRANLAPRSIDMVVARYVLVHQSEPAEFIRLAASYARPGGAWLLMKCSASAISIRFPVSPSGTKSGAGLLPASLRGCPIQMQAPASSNISATPASICPRSFPKRRPEAGPPRRSARGRRSHCVAYCRASKDLNTLEDRMREAVTAARSQITFAQQYCAWTRV